MEQQQKDNDNSYSKKTRRNIILVVLAVFFVVITVGVLVGYGIYRSSREDDKSQSDPTETPDTRPRDFEQKEDGPNGGSPAFL